MDRIGRERGFTIVALLVSLVCSWPVDANSAIALGGVSAPTDPAAHGDDAAGERPASAPAMLERANRSVFRITVNLGPGNVGMGTGFLVDSSGLALTNYHVLEGGKSASAEFELEKGTYATVEVKVVALRPDLDLALIRVPLADPSFRGKAPPPLVVRLEDPKPGEDVWAIGFPLPGRSFTKGIVSAVRRYGDIPGNERDDSGYGPDSVWVQTDCVINPGNSGGPLLDGAGAVVGVNTFFKPLQGATAFFALGSKQFAGLIRQDHPGSPPFPAAKKSQAGSEQPIAEFPRIDIERSEPASRVSLSAKDYLRYAACSRCKGDGAVQRRSVSEGGASFSKPTTQTVVNRCPSCAGRQYAAPKVVWQRATQLVDRLSKMKSEGDGTDTAVSLVKSSVKTVATVQLQPFTGFINEIAVERLTAAAVKAGEPIVCIGTLGRDIASLDAQGRLMLVKLDGRDVFVIMASPRIVSAAEKETVMVGGVLAGRWLMQDHSLVPVLQDGFVVTVATPPAQDGN
jgi:hypothetical protein